MLAIKLHRTVLSLVQCDLGRLMIITFLIFVIMVMFAHIVGPPQS